jgi:flavin-dependent dehydrogenase
MRAVQGNVLRPPRLSALVAEPTACDVAIVGASPAGLAAAHACASDGLDTILVEAGEIGRPEPPAVVGFDRLWPQTWAPPDGARRSTFEEVTVTMPGGHPITVQAPGIIVDRTRFDRWGADRARSTGAEVHEETGPWEVLGPGRLAGPAGEVAAEVVVFADGADSIASAIVDPVEAPEHRVWGITHEIDVDAREGPLAIGVGDQAPGGRTQVVPLDETTAWHWTFVRRERSQAIEQAEQALAATAERRGWSPSVVDEAQRRHVAPDPTLQRPARLAGPRTLVAGGAGGLGGLEVGLATGRSAGQAAVEAVLGDEAPQPTLERYAERCRQRYAPAYRGLDRLFRWADRTPDEVLAALARPQTGRELALDEVAGLVGDGRERWSTLAALTVGGLAERARSQLVSLS